MRICGEVMKQRTVKFHSAAILYRTNCHVILRLSASKSKPCMKDNLDILLTWVFMFYEADVDHVTKISWHELKARQQTTGGRATGAL